MSEILKTDKYDMFKFHPANAEIKMEHVNRIAASISIKNMLHMRPIMVNEDMEIIDGQHRLLAAKKLGIPIYYQIDKNLTDEDMATLNSNARVWAPSDYLHHYEQLGNENYKKLRDFLELHDLKLFDGLTILGKAGGSISRSLKIGAFQFPDKEKALEASQIAESIKEIINYIQDTSLNRLPFIRNRSLFRGLIPIVSHENFDLQTMLKKIDLLLPKITKKADTSSYFEMFKDVYNWKNQKPITWD